VAKHSSKTLLRLESIEVRPVKVMGESNHCCLLLRGYSVTCELHHCNQTRNATTKLSMIHEEGGY
jgi:hypothetical protein